MQLGVVLGPGLLVLPDGTLVVLDAISEDPPVLVEAWAHQGPPKAAQKHKVMTDALKLIWAESVLFPVGARKILALADYATSPLYTEAERVALEYADCMTLSDRQVSDELFARLRRLHPDDALVELTAIIAWENASSKFNRALRIPSQGLWKRGV